MSKDKMQHAIYQGQYTIPTSATEAASAFVMQVVRSRVPGCMVVGRQRFGKTKAIKQIIADLKEEFGDSLVLVLVQVEFSEEKPTEAKHYTMSLISIEHALPHEGNVSDKKARFQEAVTQQVATSGQRKVVLIYDDAQFLWEHQYGYLMNDYNKFEKKGIKPTYVLVGQDELSLQRKSFILANRQQLVGRFMVRDHNFHGLRDVWDVEVCCESFDDRTEYPEGSGTSYTAFFFPAAYAAGWRLKAVAGRIFDAYERLKGLHNIPRMREIPMQYFIPVIERIFNDLGDDNVLQPEISDLWIDQAILDCGYVSAESTDFAKVA